MPVSVPTILEMTAQRKICVIIIIIIIIIIIVMIIASNSFY